MALAGPTLLAADPDSSNVASYATPSVSPSAGALVVVDVWNTDGTNAITPASVTAAFSTVAGFAVVTGCNIQASAATRRLSRWVGVTTGSPGSGAVTVDYSGDAQTGCIIDVYEYTGQDGSTPTKQGTSNEGGGGGATSLSISLASALTNAGSQCCAAIGHNTNEDQTAGSGSTELSGSDVGYATPDARMGVYTEVNDQTVSASWATSSAKLAVACEIVEGSSASTITLPALSHAGRGVFSITVTADAFITLPALSHAGRGVNAITVSTPSSGFGILRPWTRPLRRPRVF